MTSLPRYQRSHRDFRHLCLAVLVASCFGLALHKGAEAGNAAEPESNKAATRPAPTAPTPSHAIPSAVGKNADDGLFAGHPDARDMKCAACHTPDGWSPARFAHERTGYDLKGQHARAACTACHTRSWTAPVPQNCAACHVDPHEQEFGSMCHSCHNEDNWQSLFTVDAHRRSQFPLSGRHAMIPCQECHIEKRERTFTRTALSCISCHAKDARSASLTTLDHGTLSTDCRGCHSPVSFSPARFVEHEACFPLVGSTHATIRCVDCHQASTVAGLQWRGTCGNASLRCAECHERDITTERHREKGVVGYVHSSERCVGCHASGR